MATPYQKIFCVLWSSSGFKQLRCFDLDKGQSCTLVIYFPVPFLPYSVTPLVPLAYFGAALKAVELKALSLRMIGPEEKIFPSLLLPVLHYNPWLHTLPPLTSPLLGFPSISDFFKWNILLMSHNPLIFFLLSWYFSGLYSCLSP